MATLDHLEQVHHSDSDPHYRRHLTEIYVCHMFTLKKQGDEVDLKQSIQKKPLFSHNSINKVHCKKKKKRIVDSGERVQ